MLNKIILALQNIPKGIIAVFACLTAIGAVRGDKNTMLYCALLLSLGIMAYLCFNGMNIINKNTIKSGVIKTACLVVAYTFSTVCVFGEMNILFCCLFMALCVAMVVLTFGTWWENTRKFLFLNKMIDPSKYEFLITFDTKNEILKYFGTLRDVKYKRSPKWLAIMLLTPFLTACSAICILATFVIYFINGELALTICQIAFFYLTLAMCSAQILNCKAGKKFYHKKNKSK